MGNSMDVLITSARPPVNCLLISVTLYSIIVCQYQRYKIWFKWVGSDDHTWRWWSEIRKGLKGVQSGVSPRLDQRVAPSLAMSTDAAEERDSQPAQRDELAHSRTVPTRGGVLPPTNDTSPTAVTENTGSQQVGPPGHVLCLWLSG